MSRLKEERIESIQGLHDPSSSQLDALVLGYRNVSVCRWFADPGLNVGRQAFGVAGWLLMDAAHLLSTCAPVSLPLAMVVQICLDKRIASGCRHDDSRISLLRGSGLVPAGVY